MSTALRSSGSSLDADLVIGAVLVPGRQARPISSPRRRWREMRQGAVLVDISIDQGGCFETSHVTTHSDPTYVVDGVVHYCVGNMPGAVPRTSTYALTNVTLPYAVAIADLGVDDAARADPSLAFGVNAYGGTITNAGGGGCSRPRPPPRWRALSPAWPDAGARMTAVVQPATATRDRRARW